MGMLGDMRKMMKTAKGLQKEHGKSLGETISQGRQMLDQATDALADQKAQADIAASGRQGTATITAVRETMMTLNEMPVLEFDLDVTVGGFGPYPVTIQQVVSRPAVPRLQPGAEVDVKVHPEDPKKVVMVASDA